MEYDFDFGIFNFLNDVERNEFNNDFIKSWENLRDSCKKEKVKEELHNFVEILKQDAIDIDFEEVIETKTETKLLT